MRVDAARPMNVVVTSSFIEPMQDWEGLPSVTLLIHANRAGSQIPAQSYESSKNLMKSLIESKSDCSAKD